MKIQRTKNAKRNIIWGLLCKAFTLILPFVVRTVFIYKLGSEYLGLNSLFISIMNMLNITELGISSAIVFSMYGPIANDDRESIYALLNFYRKAYWTVGAIITIVGLSLVPFIGYFIKGDIPVELNVTKLFLMYLASTVVNYFLYAYKKSLFEAFQRNDILSKIDLVSVGLTNVCQLLVLFVADGVAAFYWYVWILFGFNVMSNLFVAFLSKRFFPGYCCRGKIEKETLNGLKKQISGLFIGKICLMTRNSLDSIFVSAFIGLTMTTIYSNYFYVLTAVISIMGVISNAMLAGVGNSIKLETETKNYNDFMKFNFMYMWIAGVISITMFCIYENFMLVWVGPDLTMPTLFSFLFSLYFYLLKVGDMRAMYSAAVGIWWENRYRSIVEVLINLCLKFAFVYFWGVYGVIVATILPLIVVNNFGGAQILFKNYFKTFSIREYVYENILYLGIALVVGLGCFLLSVNMSGGILGLILKSCVCIVLSNLCFFFFYKNKLIFKNSKDWLVKKLARD